MLFIMAVDPIQSHFQRAAHVGLLRLIHTRNGSFWLSLYPDDLAVFANPDKEEPCVIIGILRCFGDASGLLVNLKEKKHLKYSPYGVMVLT